MPCAAYFMTECLINWAEMWGPQAAEVVGTKLKDYILRGCESELFSYQCYWLVATVATGSLVKVTLTSRIIHSILYS